MGRPVEVRVRGPLACFTRPEMKVERVSYPVITPSAARGLLEAIFWKPQFRWQVREIVLLTPVRWASFVRNEVKALASVRSKGIDITEARTQRHTQALRDVDYLIRADVVVHPGVEHDEAKYRDQFRRRVAKGQCFHRPYLGCREFAATFSEPDGTEQALPLTEDLGAMLLDMAYTSEGVEPRFFHATIADGVLKVPAYDFNAREAQ